MPPRVTRPAAVSLGRALRTRREQGPTPLTRAQLADQLGYSIDRVRQVETGTYPPSVDYIARWVEVFGPLGEDLQALWEAVRAEAAPPPPPAPALRDADGLGLVLPPGPEAAALYAAVDDPDAQERVALAVRSPARVDGAVVDYLAQVLAVHRRADDLLGPKHLIPVIKGQLCILDQLCEAGPPSVRRGLISVASQYGQFLGWLYQDAGNVQAATWWYDRTIEWALEAGNGPMVATALSMKANQAIGSRQPLRVVTLAEAAQRSQWGSPPAVHALAVQETAYGYALLGQAAQAERRLDEIADLAARSDERKEVTPWAYFFGPDFSTMQRAVVLRDIGKADLAIPMFEAGLAQLPQDAKRERGQYLARLARAHQRTGDTDYALILAEESANIAKATGSIRTIGELQRLRRQFVGQNQAVRRLDEAIKSATSDDTHRPS